MTAVNMDKPQLWKADIARSVDFYNEWFIRFAPHAYRENRKKTMGQVNSAFALTNHLSDISADTLFEHPEILPILRMATTPPIARDRLIGLTAVSASLVHNMESKRRIPPRTDVICVKQALEKIGILIRTLADIDILPWLKRNEQPKTDEIQRAAIVLADRLCGALADPIIRNAQEQRQLTTIQNWLEKRGYAKATGITDFRDIPRGRFTFRQNISVKLNNKMTPTHIPVEVVVMPMKIKYDKMPVLIECKSAGDFTNTNKRRKEEAMKISQLKTTYGNDICYILFLCGYFDGGYLGYEAAEGIDWVWEHREDDLESFGL